MPSWLGFPISVWFQLAVTYCMGVWFTRAAGFPLTFWTLSIAEIFFSTFKLHSHSMPDVTYDNDFYVHRPHARHRSLSHNDKCITSLSQIDFFYYSVISQLKNCCHCLLFCICVATRYMPLSAIKQLKNKHWIGYRKALVHQQRRGSFFTINI